MESKISNVPTPSAAPALTVRIPDHVRAVATSHNSDNASDSIQAVAFRDAAATAAVTTADCAAHDAASPPATITCGTKRATVVDWSKDNIRKIHFNRTD